jgi:tetratricopeptide (TPR) repeat protein
MVLSHVTTDNAPVWLQEGIAKSFERAWRGDTAPAPPDAASQALLQEAAASGTLLTFDELHPSIAVLPTQDMAALAFAEVATFIGRFVQEHGMPKLREALAQIRAGVDAKAALAAVAGSSFANLEKTWRKGLPRGAPDDAPHVLQRRFASAEAEPDDAENVAEKKASRFLRLGDLLWDRGRFPAATVEYGKAHRAAPLDPIVAARWARAALRRGDAAAAVKALEPQAKRYPTHAPTQSLLGAAQLRAGNRAGARAALREALLINPFDPDPHCDLAQATDDEAEARREREACKALQ